MSNNLVIEDNQEVLITFVPSDYSSGEYIYENLVLNSDLKGNGQKAGKFHITVAWIKNVKSIHYQCLKKTLDNVRPSFYSFKINFTFYKFHYLFFKDNL